MSASAIAIQAPRPEPSYMDDEITALSLQLEEAHYREETKKAKYSGDNVPDLELAYAAHLNEIEAQLAFLKDVKLAHSIANAVDTDAAAIHEITQAESQAQEDRQYAIRVSSDDPELEAPPPYTEKLRNEFIDDQVARQFEELFLGDESLYDEPEVEAGPSVPYAQRQAQALGSISKERFQCCACLGEYRWDAVSKLQCGDQYCNTCLKRVIMRAVIDKDLVYMPPRCHAVAIPSDIVAGLLSTEEMEEFQNAEIEKSTTDKTYCSNADCGKFILPRHIQAGEARCPHCNTRTCVNCKGPHHELECPADPDIQLTLALGNENRWQRCYSCRALVQIEWGCNHMTCRCGAEFCYMCGTPWRPRRCRCDLWNEENLLQRAEQVVARAAPGYLPPAERHRRIAQVQDELRDNDECEHYGRKKFSMITEGAPRRGFRCEMCNARHRNFILRCKRCQLDLCADCRRYRV